MRRRERIALLIRDAYHKLETTREVKESIGMPVSDLIALVNKGESTDVEFKSTLRVNLHTGEPDRRIEQSVLKSIAGFLNGNGGTLLIGVSDDGTSTGLTADGFGKDDEFYSHLVNLLNDKIGPEWTIYAHPRFDVYNDKKVMAVDCIASRTPIYVKDGEVAHFYVRAGNSTSELQGNKIQEYIKLRFRT